MASCMNKEFIYQSDNYDRQSQKFVIPLYVKDELGNYHFSSTGTFVKYNNRFHILFAAHALINSKDISGFYIFGVNGKFIQVSSFTVNYKIFNEEDIVIIDCFNAFVDGKNYFNLNKSHLSGFEKRLFSWTGFLSSKAKNMHNTKSPESLKKEYIHSDESGTYAKNAKYLTIVSKLHENNKVSITGKYDRKNAIFKHKGPVSMAPNPEGMSGGAMYFFAKGQKLKEDIDDTFRFAGIGIEYRKDNTIVGVSREKIIELIEQLYKDNPVEIDISIEMHSA